MKQKIDQEVSVIMYYKSKTKRVQPYLLHWQNNDYPLGDVSYYHSYLEGRERQHIFELTDKAQSIWFRLRFDSCNLHWTLEAVHDGNAY